MVGEIRTTGNNRVYESVLEFLNVPPDGCNQFPRVNASKRNRLAWLA